MVGALCIGLFSTRHFRRGAVVLGTVAWVEAGASIGFDDFSDCGRVLVFPFIESFACPGFLRI